MTSSDRCDTRLPIVLGFFAQLVVLKGEENAPLWFISDYPPKLASASICNRAEVTH